jgi:hypothetical protein
VVSWQAITATIRGTVTAFAEAERQALLLEQTIRATGGAAGRTAADIERLVQGHARAGAAAADVVRSAATQLLTFRSISGEAFDRTLAAAVDLAAVGFGSVESAAVQLGKALENPIEGLSSLTRVGVSFSAEQKRVIQALVETGRTAEAQGLILEAVEGQVGGAGAAQGAGLAGAFRVLGHELAEFGETVGGRIAEMLGLNEAIRAVASGVSMLREAISEDNEPSIEEMEARVAELIEKRDKLLAEAAASGQQNPLAVTFGEAQQNVDRLTASVEELRSRLMALQMARAPVSETGPLGDQLQALVDEKVKAEQALEAASAAIRKAPTGEAPSAEEVARVGAIAELEKQLAAEQAVLDAALARRAEAKRRAAEAQEAIRQGRIAGVIEGLRAEAEAARLTRIEQETLKAARAAGVDPERDAEAYERIAAAVRETVAARAQAGGEAQLAMWQERARLAEIEAKFGRDSAEATAARAEAERAALAAKLDAEGVAADLRDRILEAYDAAQRLASADMAGAMARARAEAEGVAAALGRAFSLVQGMIGANLAGAEEERLRGLYRDDPVRLAGEIERARVLAIQAEARRVADRLETEALDRQLREAVAAAEARARAALANKPPAAAGGGGGGGAAPVDALSRVQDEAAALLAELDQKIAQINNRVSLGLMTTAEGQNAIADAKARIAGELADLMPQLDGLGAAGEAAMERIRAAVVDLGVTLQDDLGKAVEQIAQRIDQAGENAFVSWVKNGGNAAAMLVDIILTEFLRLTYQQTIGGLLGNLVGTLFSGIFASAKGSVIAAGQLVPFAAGGLPDLGAAAVLSSLSQARDKVVDRPTLFPMARGQVGLMGEAGPEAILPLVGSASAPAVRAIMPGGGETAAALTRAASGHLAVDLPVDQPVPFAAGGVPGRREAEAEAILPLVGSASAPAVRAVGPSGETSLPLMRAASGALGVAVPFSLGGVPDRMISAMRQPGLPPGVAGASVAPQVNVRLVVNNTAAQGDERVSVEQRSEGGETVIEALIEQAEARIVNRAARGTGPLARMLGEVYGIRRVGR